MPRKKSKKRNVALLALLLLLLCIGGFVVYWKISSLSLGGATNGNGQNSNQNNQNTANSFITLSSSEYVGQVGDVATLTVTSDFSSQHVDFWFNSGNGWFDTDTWLMNANGAYSTVLPLGSVGTRQMYLKASNGVVSNTVTIVVSSQAPTSSITLSFRMLDVSQGYKDSWGVQSTFKTASLEMYYNINGQGWIVCGPLMTDGNGNAYGSQTMNTEGVIQFKVQTLDGATVSNVVSVTVAT